MTRNIVPRGAVLGVAVVGAGAALAASMSGSAQAASNSHSAGDRYPARLGVAAPVLVAGSGSGGIDTCRPAPGAPAPARPGVPAEPDAVAQAVASAARAAGTTGTITVSVGPDGVQVSGTGLNATQRAALAKQLRSTIHIDGHRLQLTLVTAAGGTAVSGSASATGSSGSGVSGPTFRTGGPDAGPPEPPPGAEGGISVSGDPGSGLTICGAPATGSTELKTARA